MRVWGPGMKNRLPKDLLKWTAAGFALAATATAEYEIAREIGMNEWIAAAVPGALDAYVVRALRSGREVLASVTAMVGVNAASHLVTAGILPVEWPLITAVSAIAPLVLWRVHALGRARHTGVHTSTEPEHTEHGRAPDNPEPPGTREHPEGCIWGHAECDGERACTVSNREHTTGASNFIACTECGSVFLGVPLLEEHQKHAGHGVLGRVRTPSTPDLDVPEWVNPPSTPPVPVHAPYADHVHGGAYEPDHAAPNGTRLLKVIPSTQPMKARHLEVVPDPGELDDRDGVTGCADGTEHWCGSPSTHTEHEHGNGLLCLGSADGRYGPEHTPSTRTADDWNLEHVSTGTLTPEDTEHMERARELFHTIGGVPPFRALKHGTPGMGTDRAKRIRAALEIENKGTD